MAENKGKDDKHIFSNSFETRYALLYILVSFSVLLQWSAETSSGGKLLLTS